MTDARTVLADWISDVACPLGFEHKPGKSDFDYADAIIAALAAAGYVIVPKEPTEKMLFKAHKHGILHDVRTSWRAMVEAASDE